MARTAFLSAFLAFVFLVLIPESRLETAIHHPSAFKFTGDGHIEMLDIHRNELLNIVYRDKHGLYNDAVLDAINHTLRCHDLNGTKHPISLKLLELIDHIQDHFHARIIQVISGYRSPEYNANLHRRSKRVAQHSLHMSGLAMDIRLAGVPTAKLGRYARSLRAGGVGVYPNSSFVHVDVGPVRTW